MLAILAREEGVWHMCQYYYLSKIEEAGFC